MASIVLGNAGSALGSSLFGNQAGASLGQLAGTLLGQVVDRSAFGGTKQTHGARIAELSVQQSTYGQMIPIIYGTVKIAGNIIWISPISEYKATISETIGGKGSRLKHAHTDYFCSISLAIALCEGPIAAVARIWADEQPFDTQAYNIRIYHGVPNQLPDPLIESIEGVGQVPAYRDLAYIVIEDLQLAIFGNRIPFFSFEVKRLLSSSQERAEDLVRSVIIIPGSGEFVYDTIPQYKRDSDITEKGAPLHRGPAQAINKHTVHDKTNAIVALDDMKSTLPNLEWVAPVVGWFGTSLDISECSIKPGVEYKYGSETSPDIWRVGKYNRSNAHLITQIDNRPIYGGSTSDAAVLRFLDELRQRGYNIMFYPILFIDTIQKPWRGRMYGSPHSVDHFFTKSDGYKNFILHYAQLVRGKVEAFVIGSEMVGLNKIEGFFTKFTAVDYFIELAREVKNILGPTVKVTYAADWSEYHHTDGGWYHLDSLWASADIDFIGIDAYFPLTEGKAQGRHHLDEVIAGWDSGEGYDYHYLDDHRKEALSPQYAWKNITWWWENQHINPDGNVSAWQPRSKKIWFTEYGFPSVDCATNQPNVFWSNDSIESHLPRHSEGRVNLFAQRVGITATERRWGSSDMIERRFLWTWDARPFPFWPDLKGVWSDGDCWHRGHWIQGKLGAVGLAQVVADLCYRAGLETADIDVSRLHEVVEGVLINCQTTPRIILEALQQAYFFDTSLIEQNVVFIPRQHKQVITVDAKDLLAMPVREGLSDTLQIKLKQEAELPQHVDVNFIDRYNNYGVANQHAQRHFTASTTKLTLNFPLVLQQEQAASIAEVNLFNAWLERTEYSFMLPPKYIHFVPGDVIKISNSVIRITSLYIFKDRCIRLEGVCENLSIYAESNLNPTFRFNNSLDLDRNPGTTHFEVIDIPLLAREELYGDHSRFCVAACGGPNWRGAVIYTDLHQPGEFQAACTLRKPATIGRLLGKLAPINTTCVLDRTNRIYVNILYGKLSSVTERELAEGINTALVGNEIIQFQHAKLIKPYQYELSNLLRGRYGTELHSRTHEPTERFILLDDSVGIIPLSSDYAGQHFICKAISLGSNTDEVKQELAYKAKTLLPFTPVYVQASASAKLHLTIKWYRRTRISSRANNSWARGSDTWDVHDKTALGEASEKYQVKILYKERIIHINTCTSNEYRIDAQGWKTYGLPDTWDELIVQVAQVSAKLGTGPYTTARIDAQGNSSYHEDNL